LEVSGVHATLSGGVGVDLSVELGPLRLRNPIMPASGCFGPELAPLLPLHRLGALVTKTVFTAARSGNAAHRVTDSGSGGALNSVGIPSPGAKSFRGDVLPRYAAHGAPVIVSIGGLAVDDYFSIAEELSGADFAAFEVNVSCPNLERGGISIGADPEQAHRVTRGVVDRAEGRPVIVKLTPNVASVEEAALAAEEAGAAALTVANTFVGLAVDLRRRRPVLGNGTGRPVRSRDQAPGGAPGLAGSSRRRHPGHRLRRHRDDSGRSGVPHRRGHRRAGRHGDLLSADDDAADAR
jgi:dihydroorotate dehydrogenase (NAD+) catalytic subunit